MSTNDLWYGDCFKSENNLRDPKRYEFVERGPDQPEVEPGFKEFLNDRSLSGTATKEEKNF